MAKKTIIIIELEDAKDYVKSLRWVRTRLIRAFEDTDDQGLRRIINKHGPILDDLIDELTQR